MLLINPAVLVLGLGTYAHANIIYTHVQPKCNYLLPKPHQGCRRGQTCLQDNSCEKNWGPRARDARPPHVDSGQSLPDEGPQTSYTTVTIDPTTPCLESTSIKSGHGPAVVSTTTSASTSPTSATATMWLLPTICFSTLGGYTPPHTKHDAVATAHIENPRAQTAHLEKPAAGLAMPPQLKQKDHFERPVRPEKGVEFLNGAFGHPMWKMVSTNLPAAPDAPAKRSAGVAQSKRPLPQPQTARQQKTAINLGGPPIGYPILIASTFPNPIRPVPQDGQTTESTSVSPVSDSFVTLPSSDTESSAANDPHSTDQDTISSADTNRQAKREVAAPAASTDINDLPAIAARSQFDEEPALAVAGLGESGTDRFYETPGGLTTVLVLMATCMIAFALGL